MNHSFLLVLMALTILGFSGKRVNARNGGYGNLPKPKNKETSHSHQAKHTGEAYTAARNRKLSKMGYRVVREIKLEATGYSTPKLGKFSLRRKTRLGTTPRPGVVAVDPNVIKLGSRIFIPGSKTPNNKNLFFCEDTGKNIKHSRIDFYFPTIQEAKKFGRKEVFAYVLELRS